MKLRGAAVNQAMRRVASASAASAASASAAAAAAAAIATDVVTLSATVKAASNDDQTSGGVPGSNLMTMRHEHTENKCKRRGARYPWAMRSFLAGRSFSSRTSI